eukprot:Colp12_sorted_trinity150504_noHs@11680
MIKVLTKLLNKHSINENGNKTKKDCSPEYYVSEEDADLHNRCRSPSFVRFDESSVIVPSYSYASESCTPEEVTRDEPFIIRSQSLPAINVKSVDDGESSDEELSQIMSNSNPPPSPEDDDSFAGESDSLPTSFHFVNPYSQSLSRPQTADPPCIRDISFQRQRRMSLPEVSLRSSFKRRRDMRPKLDFEKMVSSMCNNNSTHKSKRLSGEGRHSQTRKPRLVRRGSSAFISVPSMHFPEATEGDVPASFGNGVALEPREDRCWSDPLSTHTSPQADGCITFDNYKNRECVRQLELGLDEDALHAPDVYGVQSETLLPWARAWSSAHFA